MYRALNLISRIVFILLNPKGYLLAPHGRVGMINWAMDHYKVNDGGQL
ncbi:hypothetical protein [Desulfitobacterium sp. AusDCA]